METNTPMTTLPETVESQYVAPTVPAPVQEEKKAPGFWAFVGLIVLFTIPIIGLIANIVFACGANKNQSIINFSRAYLAVTLVGCLVMVLLGAVLLVTAVQWVTGIMAAVELMTTDMQEYMDQFESGEINEEELAAKLYPYIEQFARENLGGLITEEALVDYLEEYLGQELGDLNISDFGDADNGDVQSFLSDTEELLSNAA